MGVSTPYISDGVKDTSLKAKAKTKDFKIVLEDEDLSSRTPTLPYMPTAPEKVLLADNEHAKHGTPDCPLTLLSSSHH